MPQAPGFRSRPPGKPAGRRIGDGRIVFASRQTRVLAIRRLFELIKADWLDIIQAAALVSAVVVALWAPRWDREQKRIDDLVGFRNLACFAAQYVNTVLLAKLKDEPLSPAENYSFEAIKYGLKGIELKDIYPPYLAESFAAIYYWTMQAEQWSRVGVYPPKDRLEKGLDAIKASIGRINATIKELSISEKQLAQCAL